ncbi:KH domain-containing protein [Candidatus Woesebacteria bacterium]|nr:KH domain-containing protein [Candidatus Woesebacteria bacterium]
MKNLLEYIIIHLVEHPEDVRIDEEQDVQGVVYTVHVNQEDVGRIIGKGGSVIHAIRSIGRIRAIKEGIRARINVADGSQPAPQETAPETAAASEETATSQEEVVTEAETTTATE